MDEPTLTAAHAAILTGEPLRQAIGRWQEAAQALRDVWVEQVLAVAAEMRRAREAHPSNQAFHEWLAANVGDRLSADERAGFITLGENLELAREVLRASKRLSIRLICERELMPRLRSAAKTPWPLPWPLATPYAPPVLAVIDGGRPEETDRATSEEGARGTPEETDRVVPVARPAMVPARRDKPRRAAPTAEDAARGPPIRALAAARHAATVR